MDLGYHVAYLSLGLLIGCNFMVFCIICWTRTAFISSSSASACISISISSLLWTLTFRIVAMFNNYSFPQTHYTYNIAFSNRHRHCIVQLLKSAFNFEHQYIPLADTSPLLRSCHRVCNSTPIISGTITCDNQNQMSLTSVYVILVQKWHHYCLEKGRDVPLVWTLTQDSEPRYLHKL